MDVVQHYKNKEFRIGLINWDEDEPVIFLKDCEGIPYIKILGYRERGIFYGLCPATTVMSKEGKSTTKDIWCIFRNGKVGKVICEWAFSSDAKFTEEDLASYVDSYIVFEAMSEE